MKRGSKKPSIPALRSPERAADAPIPLDPAPLIAKALSSFEREVGGREALVGILTHQTSESVEAELVVNLLASTENARFSLAALCARAGISVGRFLQLFALSRGVQAQLAAMNKVWPALPGVAEDVVRRAIPYDSPCLDCNATGTKPHRAKEPATPCTYCAGRGIISTEPDLERQKLALQIGGILKPGSAQVVIDNSRHETYTPVSMRAFITATNRLLYDGHPTPPAAPIEAEIVPEESKEGVS